MFQKRFVTKSNNGKQVRIKKVNSSKKLYPGKKRPDIEHKGLKVKLKNSSKDVGIIKGVKEGRLPKKYPEGFMFVDNVKGIRRRKERRCIYTVSIGKELKWLFDITHIFMKEYAKKCEADFVVIDDNWRAYDEHPCFLKQAINSLWYRYDRVLYVDSDVLIKPNAPNIFEEVPVGFLGAFDEFTYSSSRLKTAKIKYMKDYVEKHNSLFPNNKFTLDTSNISSGFFNMGVFLCDKDTNPHTPPISNDMRLGISPHYDQVFCNVTIKDKGIPTFRINKKWNTFRSFIKNDSDFKEAYFIHYVSDHIKKIQNDINNNDLLSVIKNKRIRDALESIEIVPDEFSREPNVCDLNIQETRRMMCTIIVGDAFRELSKYTLPFIQKYADKCKSDLIIFDEEFIEGYAHPVLMKTEINKFWGSYDQVCYVDLDMLIKEETPDIFNLVPIGTLGCVERGRSWAKKKQLNPKTLMNEYLKWYIKAVPNTKYTLEGYDYRYFNAGLFVCDKNTIPYTKEELVLTGYEHEFYEQTLFNLLRHVKGIPVTELPLAFNRSPSENPMLKSKDLLSHCWISHYTVGEKDIIRDSNRLNNKEYEINDK